MDSPVATVKSALNPGNLVKWLIVGVVGFAILDFFGFTDALIRPVTFFRTRYGKTSTAP